MTEHPTVNVARDLRAIVDMTTRLEAQAIAKANDALMPGGLAMVNLGYVADLSVWNRRVELAEQSGSAHPGVDEDPDDLWPAFQKLRYWSEQWRTDLNMDYDDPRWYPTIASEASFLANPDVLAWVWDNELHFEAFAEDEAPPPKPPKRWDAASEETEAEALKVMRRDIGLAKGWAGEAASVTEPGQGQPNGSQVGSYASVVPESRNGTIQREGDA